MGSNGGGKGGLSAAANAENEVADSLSEAARKTIADAMNGLPDDVMAYVMAYTPASFSFRLSRGFACSLVALLV